MHFLKTEVWMIHSQIYWFQVQHSSSTVTLLIKSSPLLLWILSVNIKWYSIIDYTLRAVLPSPRPTCIMIIFVHLYPPSPCCSTIPQTNWYYGWKFLCTFIIPPLFSPPTPAPGPVTVSLSLLLFCSVFWDSTN